MTKLNKYGTDLNQGGVCGCGASIDQRAVTCRACFRDANPWSGHVKDEAFRSALSLGLPIGGALQDAGWTCAAAERWYRRQGDMEMSRMLGRHVRAFREKG